MILRVLRFRDIPSGDNILAVSWMHGAPSTYDDGIDAFKFAFIAMPSKQILDKAAKSLERTDV